MVARLCRATVTEDEGNELLLSHTAWVHALARSLVAERDLAADVAQETMLVAWRRGLGGVLDVRAWLAQILRRLASRRAQSEQTRRVREQEHAPRDPAPATAELVAKASMQREVVDAVLRLDEPYRTTVLLRFLEERSYQQIASATAAPIETVRTRIKRGLQQLRQDLDRRHGAARAWALPILGFAGFHEAAVATAGAVSTAAAGAAGAGVLTMSMQAKLVVGVGVLCAGMLAWQFWPAAEGTPPAAGRTANEVAAAVAAVPQPSRDAVAPERSAAEVAETARAEPQPARPQWTASGRIVDEVTNQGVAGAWITLAHDSSRESTPTTQSGADGTFTLDFDLHALGLVELAVEHPDYARTHVPLHEIVARSRAASSQHAAIGDVLMARGGALSGRVFAADGTTPVPGASIRPYRATYGAPMQFFRGHYRFTTTDRYRFTTTDRNGHFVLPFRVGPGYRREWLVAWTEQGVAWTEQGIGWRELQPSRRAHADAGFDIVLRPAATLRAHVVDEQGRPLEGALVVAYPACEPISSPYDAARKSPLEQAPLPRFLRFTTNRSGIAELHPPIGLDGFQFGTKIPGGQVSVAVGFAGHRRWNQTIELAAGEVRDLEVRLVAGVEVDIAGVVLTRDGAPIANAAVTIGAVHASTDASGRFRFEHVDVAEGVVQVQAAAAGFVSRSEVVDCDSYGREHAVELRLDQALAVRGIVVDQDGSPVAQAFVSAGPGVNTETRGDGRFELAGVALAQRHLVVTGSRVGAEFATMVAPIPEPMPDELRIVVQRNRGGARVEIALRDRVTGTALEPAGCWLFPVSKDGAQMVGRELQIRDGLCHDVDTPAGQYRVQAEMRDGRRVERLLEVPAGVPVVREQLLLDPAGSARCTLDLSLLAKVPERLRVEIVPFDSGRLHVVGRTGGPPQGDHTVLLSPATEREIEVRGVRPGPFVLRVLDEVAGEVIVDVAPGGTAVVKMQLVPAGRLELTCERPATFDSVLVHSKRADSNWSTPQQLMGCRGKRSLGGIVVPAGAVAWRVGYLPDGGEMTAREGQTTVLAGGSASVRID